MQAFEFPQDFRTQGHHDQRHHHSCPIGGTGPAVVLLHGYGETGDMWAPLAVDLARDHTVMVPDLRGMGLSSKPAGGFDKKTQAGDIAGVLDALKVDARRSRHPRHRQHGRLCVAAQYPTASRASC